MPAEAAPAAAPDPTPAPTPAATPAVTPAPTDTPVPAVDAPWYAERNELIRRMIRQYRPEWSEERIDEELRLMYIDPDRPMVALTFDDGPVPGVTDGILDVLERYHVRATFFVCGWRFGDERVRQLARRAVALGCELGNHSYYHENMQEENIVAKRQSVQRTNQLIYEAAAYEARVLRPPGGRSDWDLQRVAREENMAVILWTQSGNVHETDPGKIAQNVEKQIVDGDVLCDGDIILLHDTKTYMVDAVEIIVPRLLEQGYQLVTVWELINCSEEGFVSGERYDCQ